MSIPAFSRGVSLLEVLAALAIFTLGAVSLSAWMTLATRAAHAAYLHTQASFLAGEMVERMRANPGGVWADAYEGEAKARAADCTVVACMPLALAAYDRAVWAVRLKTVLPDGGGAIHCDRVLAMPSAGAPPPFGGLCTLSLHWVERGAGDRDHRGAAVRGFAWVFQP